MNTYILQYIHTNLNRTLRYFSFLVGTFIGNAQNNFQVVMLAVYQA